MPAAKALFMAASGMRTVLCDSRSGCFLDSLSACDWFPPTSQTPCQANQLSGRASQASIVIVALAIVKAKRETDSSQLLPRKSRSLRWIPACAGLPESWTRMPWQGEV